jgi:hypothetical protein
MDSPDGGIRERRHSSRVSFDRSVDTANATARGASAGVALSWIHQLNSMKFDDLVRLSESGDKIAPAIIKAFKNRGSGRNMAEAAKLFNSIPAVHRGSPAEVRSFLVGKDFSHYISKSNAQKAGLSAKQTSLASNIRLEGSAANAARGASNMTLREDVFLSLKNNARAIRSAAFIGAAVSGVAGLAVHGTAVREGRETESDAGRAILAEMFVGGASSAAICTVGAVCPPAGIVFAAFSLGSLAGSLLLGAARQLCPERVTAVGNAMSKAADVVGINAGLRSAGQACSALSHTMPARAASAALKSATCKAAEVADATYVPGFVGRCAGSACSVVAGITSATLKVAKPPVAIRNDIDVGSDAEHAGVNLANFLIFQRTPPRKNTPAMHKCLKTVSSL